MASDDQSINLKRTNEILRTRRHNDLSLRFTCLPARYVLVVAIHPLGGSRANRHHTPNPRSGAAQPTQDGDHTSHEQSTRVAFDTLPGKAQDPSQSQ